MKNAPHRSIHSATQNKDDFDALCQAFLLLKTKEECKRFIVDLCTPAEILALAERWKIACILDEGRLSYRDIHKVTGVSLTTIGRVARFLIQEPHAGYKTVIERFKKRKNPRTAASGASVK